MSRAWILGLSIWVMGGSVALADPPFSEELAAATARISARPHEMEPVLVRAEVLRRAGRFDEALADLRLAEALHPGDARAVLLRAEVLIATRRFDEAQAELDALLAEGRGSLRAGWLLGSIHERFDRFDEAARAYDDALSRGSHPEVVLARGRVLEQLGRLEEAAEGLAAGVEAHAGAVVLRDALIRVLLRQGAYDRALVQIDAAMAHAQVRTRWLLLRGDALAGAGRSRDARTARQEALREADLAYARRPSAANLANRGRARLALGRVDEAIADLEQALRRVPRMPDVHVELAAARRLRAGGAR